VDGHPRATWPAVMVTVLVVGWLRSRPVELAFDVGLHERHRVVFRFNPFLGYLAITVDGSPVVRDLPTFTGHLTKAYDFDVGSSELHRVRIEKRRSLVLAGVRVQPVRAYVDDVLSAELAA
jgi:hypothetical protein